MINRSDLEVLAPGFLEWLDEPEVYSSRYERLCETFAEFDAHAHTELVKWLLAAYMKGWNER
jgi:hypothetical protein